MGGGTILILLLLFMKGLEQHTAQAINLIFFIPTSIAAIVVGIKNKNIELRFAFPIVIAGIVGAVIGAKLGTVLNAEVLRKLFGIFLLFIAMYEIYLWYQRYRKEK